MVSPKAELDRGVVVGPYSIVEEKTFIGAGTEIDAHVMIKSCTTIGPECRIYPYVSLGTDPQDVSYQGEETHLVIGQKNVIREFTTLNRGTPHGGGVTRLGDENMIMSYAHVAHDCQIGSHVVLVNLVTLAGHVVVEDWAVISGLAAIQQFCRVGTHAFIGARAGLDRDVPPFCLATGYRARLIGLNTVGLTRRGFGEEKLNHLKEAYRILFRKKDGVMATRLKKVEAELGHVPEVGRLVEFIRASERGICQPNPPNKLE